MTAEKLLRRYAAGERNFAGVRFWSSSVPGSALCEIDLSNITLSGAYLAPLNFGETDLSGAKMIGAYSIGSRLRMADFSGADLTGANLTKAILVGADLTKAILTGANLSMVDMSKIELYGEHSSRHLMSFVPEDTFLWQTTLPDGTFEELPRFYDVGYY